MRIVFVCIGFALLVLAGCTGSAEYCDSLRNKAADPQFARWLVAWTESEFASGQLRGEDWSFGGGMVPGSHVWLGEFPWSQLGFSEGQVRLIGDSIEQPEGFFYGERSRNGFVVHVNSVDIEPKLKRSVDSVEWVTERVAVVCGERK